jgi:outer membrane receptor for ferrienterochelin and colicin
VDVNKDGFSDVGRLEAVYLHPTIYYYLNENNTLSLGLNSALEERRGGDMEVLGRNPVNTGRFFIQSESYRNTGNLVWENKLSHSAKFILKGTVSSYRRNILTNVFGMEGRQLSWFSEATFIKKMARHNIVAGANLTGDRFRKQIPDSMPVRNYSHYTTGVFIQDSWLIHPKFIIETGLRTDLHSDYGTFILPRISLLFKPSPVITTRLGGGLGYKIPGAFESEIDERDYKKIQPLSNLEAERSYGANWDINFKKELGEVELTINQSVFLTHITKPIALHGTATTLTYFNADLPVITKGIETWVMVSYEGLEAYAGYTLVDAMKEYDLLQPHVELSARNKFASVISYEFSEKFRACLEATFIGRQWLEDGRRSPSYPILAGMVQYNLGRLSFVLNCENWFDYRQTKRESIVIPPSSNPSFKQLWAPIDGRIINLSVKLKL